MQLAFTLLTAGGIGFFGWRWLHSGRIDPMTIAFVSLVVYFLPGLFGFVQFGSTGGNYSAALVPGAYLVMAIAMLAIVAGAFAIDRLPSRRAVSLPAEAMLPAALLAMVAIGGAVSAKTVGAFYFCDKATMLDHIDQWYYLAAYAAPTCLVASVITRQWVPTTLSGAALAFDIVAGFRAEAAVACIALIVVGAASTRMNKRSLARFAVILAACAFGFLFIKQTLYTIKVFTDPICHAALVASPTVHGKQTWAASPSAAQALRSLAAQTVSGRTLINAVTESEPFVIQATLNEAVRQNFHTGADYLLGQILSGVPGGKSLFGIDSDNVKSFNEIAQPALFPTVTDFGMANSPWAQAYAAGGYPMVLVFALAFAALLGALSFAFRISSGALRGVVAVISTWAAFYFQRNDLLVEIGILKEVVYISAGACLVAWATYAIRRQLLTKAMPTP